MYCKDWDYGTKTYLRRLNEKGRLILPSLWAEIAYDKGLRLILRRLPEAEGVYYIQGVDEIGFDSLRRMYELNGVLETIKKSDVLILNDGEARQLFNTANLAKAANEALKLGPKAVIIKKGEHGALLFTKNRHFNAPGYPLEVIKDPTGCGDCFGGAFIGYLAKIKDLSEPNFRKAIVYGSVVASHNAEDFGLNRLKSLTINDIEKRYQEMKDIREF